MQETIREGTIMVREGTQYPGGLQLESTSFSPGWRSITSLDGHAMDRKMHDAGWTFFYLAGENNVTVFGSDCPDTLRRAIKKILDPLKSQSFNSLEVTRITFKQYLGMTFATVSFHMRNLQEGMFLHDGDNLHPWEDSRLVAA